MPNQFIRTQLILGRDALKKLERARVALFGLGGVGGYALEGLVRAGIGHLLLVDNDSFSESNLNRQLLATRNSLGRSKAEVARERVLSINPGCEVELRECFFLPENAQSFDFSGADYIIDAIDTISGKLALIRAAQEKGIPIISCMGTGNKIDPGALRVADIYHTRICPLARVMRRECKKRGLAPFPVVYSIEEPLKILEEEKTLLEPELAKRQAEGSPRRDIPGSTPFVPAAAGLLLAQKVVCDLLEKE